ncbi:MAG: hypothetical protein OER80_11530, partial [Gammaproteobacteria bacterium]|nr:hypothetical protein [Gammaproteobacteria bacterium]
WHAEFKQDRSRTRQRQKVRFDPIILFGFFMGNSAENILTQLDCPLLTVRPSGFVTAITLEA